MLRITGNKDEIIVREINADELIGASFVLLLLSFIVYSALSAGKSFSNSFWFFFIVSPFFIFFLYKTLTLTIVTTKINRVNKIISVRKQTLFKYKFDVYTFNEIEVPIYLNFAEGKIIGNTRFQQTIPLKDGRQISISSSGGSKEIQYFETVDLINEFIFDSHELTPLRLHTFND